MIDQKKKKKKREALTIRGHISPNRTNKIQTDSRVDQGLKLVIIHFVFEMLVA